MDHIILSRIQFAFTVSFHIIFPAFSIGLVAFIALIEAMWLKTNQIKYFNIAKFWTKVFALTFGMGVVSGIVMEFQFGTNWGEFSKHVGAILGALLVWEVMTAFFIEAGFLGIMLFGWNKVGKKLHFSATLMVAIGTLLSAYWIMAANTWMQHPVGYAVIDGKYIATQWHHIVFNSVLIVRFIHMLLAAYISAGFVILSIAAYYLIKNQHLEFATTCYRWIWSCFLVMIPLQIVVGDFSGLYLHHHQPIKSAAMEGIWNTQKGAPYLIFAIPHQKEQKNSFEIKIPKVASFINTHSWDGELTGLKSVGPQDQPNVAVVFYSFRIMVYIGMLMLLLTLLAGYLLYKKKLETTQWLQKITVFCAPIGFIAIITGWFTAEVGRQPWAVYGLLRTQEVASNVPVRDVAISMILIVIVYGVIFGYCYFKFLKTIIHQGPMTHDDLKALDYPFNYMATSVDPDSGEQS